MEGKCCGCCERWEGPRRQQGCRAQQVGDRNAHGCQKGGKKESQGNASRGGKLSRRPGPLVALGGPKHNGTCVYLFPGKNRRRFVVEGANNRKNERTGRVKRGRERRVCSSAEAIRRRQPAVPGSLRPNSHSAPQGTHRRQSVLQIPTLVSRLTMARNVSLRTFKRSICSLCVADLSCLTWKLAKKGLTNYS